MILNSPYISGSLTVTGNTNLIGALTVTGSLAGTATSSSFAYTASSAVSAYTAASAVNATTALTASYATSFTVGGTLTAQTLVVQTITSSVSFITGSTRFGSLLTNTHDFTGSVRITGSLTVNTTGTEFQVTNNGVVMGNLLADSHSVTGSLRVTGSGTFTSTISAIGESTLFQGAYNDPVPNTVAVLKMSSIPTPSLASTVVGARMSGNATANVDTYAGYFSNISTVSGTGLSYGIFATASFHTFIGETRFAQGVFNDPINGTVASIKISATPRSGAPTAVFTTGITGTASSGQNTFAGYFTNTSTVSGGGVNYGIYATGSNHFFGGNVGVGTTSPSTVFHINGSTPRMAVITTSGALSSGFYDAFQILAANQTGGGLSLNVGKAESNNNLAKMVYFHSSDGSTSNRLGFGFYGADGLVNILASGNVGINTTSPYSKLDVRGGIAMGNADTYPKNIRFVKQGSTSITFTALLGTIGAWRPGHALIKVSGGQNGLQEYWAAWFYVRIIAYFASSAICTVVDSGGDTGSVSFSSSNDTNSPQTVNFILTDGGGTTNTMIADIDLTYNEGIVSIS